MAYPSFNSGDVLNASDMNAVGLWLVKTQTIGSAVSSQAVTGAFSADYDKYLITVSPGTASTGSNLRLQLGSATTQYYSALNYVTYGSGAPTTAAQSNVNAYFDWCGHLSTVTFTGMITVQNPYLSKYTLVQATFDNGNDVGVMHGVLKDTTSYTGFTITPGSGTITGGTIRVYGYRN